MSAALQADTAELAVVQTAGRVLTEATRQHCFSRLLTLLGWACKPAAAPKGRQADSKPGHLQEQRALAAGRAQHAVSGFAACLFALFSLDGIKVCVGAQCLVTVCTQRAVLLLGGATMQLYRGAEGHGVLLGC